MKTTSTTQTPGEIQAKAQERAEFAARMNSVFDLDGIPPLYRPGLVAAACGISLHTAVKYLSGRSMPRQSRAYILLADQLEVSLEWLAGASMRFEGRALSVEEARLLFRHASVPPTDQVWLSRLLLAVNNGSRRARQILAMDKPIAGRVALYVRGTKRTLRGPITGPAKVIHIRGTDAGGEQWAN